ncbi:malonyl CoA-ACP transacylase [Labrys miyagiensis]|uniref:Malonyl CoA-ACP transacylase n=1 Tax=Labrys miyagiensis TaxID=346912 RepID=A0ABQ6CNN9_9HYPH|nr:acyltransferase domain-containing protein [Labrys miyagiensis]GLS19827.1 malonyl CoA-ACP transacylase [Labrys miyagiensis]
MLALLCSGQGLLSPTMFDLTAGEPEAEPVFAAAQALLGRDPCVLVRDHDDPLLHANRLSQILSVSAVLALHACIAAALPPAFAVTGYSLGEMAAWSIAGAWSAETALQLTDRRARVMDKAGGGEGQLGYVRGLTRQAVEALASRHGCAIAIINPDRLFVVGGARADITALCREAESAGAAKAALLDVHIASHTPRLSQAVVPLREALEASAAADPKPGCLLLAGSDGSRVFKAAHAIPQLAAQVAQTIDWAATLEALGESGVDRILDLGPGQVLAEMARTALPQARCYAADGFHSLEGLRDWLATAGGG